MRVLLVIASALALVAPASAHLIAQPKAKGLEAREASQEKNLAHASYVCRKGGGYHRYWACHAQRWLDRELDETRAQRIPQYGVRGAICAAFGSYCDQAWAVSACESGHSIWARNGQYLGLFQMGDYARSTYGHSNTAIGQARAAARYFRAAGSDWSPWACKPW